MPTPLDQKQPKSSSHVTESVSELHGLATPVQSEFVLSQVQPETCEHSTESKLSAQRKAGVPVQEEAVPPDVQPMAAQQLVDPLQSEQVVYSGVPVQVGPVVKM